MAQNYSQWAAQSRATSQWQAPPQARPAPAAPQRAQPQSWSQGTARQQPPPPPQQLQAKTDETYVVMSTGGSSDEVVVRTLLGEYREAGSNHGRKVFKKVAERAGADVVDVFMYYWGDVDGASFEGWWFGNKLGGTQVWSQCKSNSLTPPSTGWKIPWDGAVRKGISVIPKAEAGKLQEEQKKAALEEKDMNVFNQFLPEATMKTNAAEDAVEKAKINAEMIEGEEVDATPLLDQTEAAVRDAQKAVGEARIYLNAKMAVANRFESERVKTNATTELKKMQDQLAESQTKLNPFKTVRQDFGERQAAKKLITDVEEKFSPADIAVDAAQELVKELQAGAASKEMVQSAEKAIQEASQQLTEVMGVIAGHMATASAAAKEELTKVQQRVKEGQERLSKLKGGLKSGAERVSSGTLLVEGETKLVAVTEAVRKAADAEGPFIMGVEDLPLDDMLSAIKECETATVAACSATSTTKRYIATKLVEVRRFSEGPAKEATQQLQKLQAQLDTQTSKLTVLRANTADRKKNIALREAEAKVDNVEALVQKVTETASVFEDEARLVELSAQAAKEAASETMKHESVASQAVTEAKQFVIKRQVECKGKDAKAEHGKLLMALQHRLNAGNVELGKLKKLISTLDQRLATKKQTDEAVKKVVTMEEKVSKADEVVMALINGLEATYQEAQSAISEANVVLKTESRKLEAQQRSATGVVKDDLVKLQPRVKAAQERLDKVIVTMKSQSDDLQVKSSLKEATSKIKEAEEAVEAADEASKNMLNEEEQSAEQASSALTNVENTTQNATTLVANLKTFLAMKKLNARKLAEAPAKEATEELTKMQVSFEETAKKFQEIRKTVVAKIGSAVKKDSVAKVEELEKLVKASTAATAALKELGDDVTEDAMKEKCEKARAAKEEAETASKSTLELLTRRQEDATSTGADGTTKAVFTTSLAKLKKLQTTLEEQTKVIKNSEHEFVSGRLVKEANKMMEELERQMETTSKFCSPLVEDVTNAVFMAHCIDTLRAHARRESLTTDQLFSELKGEDGSISEAKFVAFLLPLPEMRENKDGFEYSSDELELAFKCMARSSKDETSGKVDEAAFMGEMEARYLCKATVVMTDIMDVKGAKSLRKIAAEEVLMGLEEPVKDEASGMVRVKIKAIKDDAQGFATISNKNGTEYLVSHSSLFTLRLKAQQKMDGTQGKIDEIKAHVEGKLEELKEVPSMKDALSTLEGLQPRISGVTDTLAELKTGVEASEKNQANCMQAAKKRQKENADKKAVSSLTEDIEEKANALKEDVEKYVPKAEALISSTAAANANVLKEMGEVLSKLQETQVSITQTQEAVTTNLEECKGKGKGKGKLVKPIAEARGILTRLKVLLSTLEIKCKKPIAPLQEAKKAISDESHEIVMGFFRQYVRQKGLSPDKLSQELGKGGDVSVESMKKYIERIPGAKAKLKPGSLDLALERYSSGISKLSLLGMLQEYRRCVKDIAITTQLEVKGSKTLRKLEVSEVVEILEVGTVSGMMRLRCRTFTDQQEGWVTKKGNQGYDFLSEAPKPYFVCLADSSLHTGFESYCAEVRKVMAGEVFELLQGPQKEEKCDIFRVKGKSIKSGKPGWVTQQVGSGEPLLDPVKCYVCKSGAAITDAFDITTGKTIRKLEVGEVMEMTQDAKEDADKSITRVKVKCKKDGLEGWVTAQGNQGTTFLEEAKDYHVCKSQVPLEMRMIPGGKVLEELAEGDLFQVLEGPKTHTKEGAERIRGRNLSDGAEGWFEAGDKWQPWQPQYKCISGVILQDQLEPGPGEALRDIPPGEIVEAVDVPVHEAGAGVMRLRVRAGGVVGFVTIKESDATVNFEPIKPESES